MESITQLTILVINSAKGMIALLFIYDALATSKSYGKELF